ncbi:hypothetical protein GCM10009566_66200 [Streptomyces murinus]
MEAARVAARRAAVRGELVPLEEDGIRLEEDGIRRESLRLMGRLPPGQVTAPAQPTAHGPGTGTSRTVDTARRTWPCRRRRALTGDTVAPGDDDRAGPTARQGVVQTLSGTCGNSIQYRSAFATSGFRIGCGGWWLMA